MKDCGWEEAALVEQQDTSEAFSFITETLQLPLLQLKMDIYHTGTEDAKDDHKLIEERLLEVAVPDEVTGSDGISLENCLENYFNNRVEVRRHLERSNTLSSIRSGKPLKEKEAQHVEVSELAWSSPNTPISDSIPSTQIPTRPVNRLRTDSIIRQRVIEEPTGGGSTQNGVARVSSLRKGSTRKEVLMPAWQFFNLLRKFTNTLFLLFPHHRGYGTNIVSSLVQQNSASVYKCRCSIAFREYTPGTRNMLEALWMA